MPPFDDVGEVLAASPEKVVKRRYKGAYNLTSLHFLAQETVARLRGFFDAKGQRPSDEMWRALTELASVLEDMAEGRCPPKFYLSSLDPGVGKTQTVTHFLKALTASNDHLDVGVLICVSRLDEIDRFVQEMELARIEYAVLTSDQERNKLGIGSERSRLARVLFTTPQMIESRGAGRDFDDIRAFQFFGRPRQVRIWDESILPGQAVTLNRYDLACLPRAFVRTKPDLAQAIFDVCNEIEGVEDGSTYQVPDFEARSGFDLNRALSYVSSDPDRQVLTALWRLSGKTASVRRDGPAFGNTMLDYRETLPENLAPLVILDASGRVRTTYRQWRENRGGLEWLATATKRYDNLTVHCWQTGGGKRAFRDNSQALLDGIAETINSKPDEDWLVVHHKDGINLDFAVVLKTRITGNPERVKFIHWGNHHATNAYVEVPNVILAGTLFYRPSYYEALTRLAADKRPAQGAISKTVEEEVTIGEHRHLILQALCRGSVRRCQGAMCAPCNAYIIAAARSGIPEALPAIFPGCRVERWSPVKRDLRGKVKEAADFVLDWFEKNPDSLLRFNVVQRATGMTPQNFKSDVRRHPDFIEALDNHGITEAWRMGDKRRGFLKPRFAEALPEE